MKNVDITEIVKRSLYEAKKSHGLIQEKKKPIENMAAKEWPEFDKTIHMPKIAIEPEIWGNTFSQHNDPAYIANSIAILDDTLNSIRGSKPGLDKIKDTLAKFNSALGITTTTEGAITYEDISEENFNVSSVVSSLMLRQLLVSMIRYNKAGSAGDIWEGLVARILGKNLPKGKSIEDIEMETGDKVAISLKLIGTGGNSTIEGSIQNLFKILSDNQGLTVRYIIGEKDVEDDPFVVKFMSFDLNRENVFSFTDPNSNPASIKANIESILKDRAPPNQNLLAALQSMGRSVNRTHTWDQILGPQPTDKNEISNYAKAIELLRKLGVSEDSEEVYFDLVFGSKNNPKAQNPALEKPIEDLNTALQDLPPSKEVIDIEKYLLGKGDFEEFKPIPGEKPEDAEKRKEKIDKESKRLAGLSGGKIFQSLINGGTWQDWRKSSKVDPTYLFKGGTLKALMGAVNTYDPRPGAADADRALRLKLKNIINALAVIDRIYKEQRNKIIKKVKDISREENYENQVNHTFTDNNQTYQLSDLIDLFWNAYPSLVMNPNEPIAWGTTKKGGGKKQFSVSVKAVKEKPDIDVDTEYPPIYLGTQELFVSTKKTVQLFEFYAEKIYRDRHEFDGILHKYFLQDRADAMNKLPEVLKQTIEDSQLLKDGTGEYQKASQLGKGPSALSKKQQVAENKKVFTRNYIDDILDDL